MSPPHPRPALRRVLASLLVVLAAGCGGGEDERAPTIVFLSIDTLAAGHTSLHGYPRDTTPNLRALAAEAVTFEAAWANAAWTTPSYMSQFTGLYPDSHRLVDERGEELALERPWHLFEHDWTLAELLARGGYRTAAFVDNPNIGPELGFAQGFEVYDTHAIEAGALDPEAGIRTVLARGLDWLDERLVEGGPDGPPLLLFLQALDPHAPYLPPPGDLAPFEGDGLGVADTTAPVAEDWNAIFRAIPRYVVEPLAGEGPGAPPPRRPVGPLVDAYDAEIRATDRAIGDLVAALRERGLLDEVVLVVSSDHGESMLEDGSLFSHQAVQEEVLHVPLVLRLPGGRRGGTRVAEPVQLVDLFPTLLELAGLWHAALTTHGSSLLPLLEGGSRAARPSYATAHVFRGQALRSGGWKLVRTDLRAALANPRALLSHPAAAPWVEERLGIAPEQVVGTRALGLAEVLGGLPSGVDAASLLQQLEAALAARGPRLFRYEGGRAVEVAAEEHRPIVERLTAELESAAALARERQQPGRTPERPGLDAAGRAALDHLGY